MALKLESAGGVLSVELHSQPGGKMLARFLVVLAWCAAVLFFGAGLVGAIQDQDGWMVVRYLAVLTACSAAAGGVLYVFAEALFGHDIVEVSATSLKIRSVVLRRVTSQREFANNLVRNLSYGDWSTDQGTQTAIRFEYQSEAILFGRLVSEENAWAVIDAMCKVYHFSTPEPDKSPGFVNWSQPIDRA